jgi:hypothetical protein
MLQKILFTGMASLCLLASTTAQSAAADTSAPAPNPFKFSGFADVYYRYDFAKTAGNNRTSFTNSHNDFELGMVSAKLEHSLGNVGFLADIGFGRRAEEFAYTDINTRLAIKQLNLSYITKGGLKLTAGNWATHIGYELVDPYLNRNYSMSYMFSYGPFSHTGIKAEKTFGNWGAMIGMANPTDFKSFAGNEKYVIGQLSTTGANEAVKVYLNYQGGKFNDSSRVKQVDIVLTAALAEKFSLGMNGTAASYQFKDAEKEFGDMNTWWGAALYLNFDPKAWFGLTLRSEYFSDTKGLNVFGSVGGGSLVATTFSANFKAGNLILIPEVRFESASKEIFTNQEDGFTKTATSLVMAAVYTF